MLRNKEVRGSAQILMVRPSNHNSNAEGDECVCLLPAPAAFIDCLRACECKSVCDRIVV